MTESKKTSAAGSGGISFGQALTLLFVGLKLTGHVDWSWWSVLSPVLVLMVLGGIAGVQEFVNERNDRNRRGWK